MSILYFWQNFLQRGITLSLNQDRYFHLKEYLQNQMGYVSKLFSKLFSRVLFILKAQAALIAKQQCSPVFYRLLLNSLENIFFKFQDGAFTILAHFLKLFSITLI